MVTKKQTLIAGALLLSTWFRIDAVSSFIDCQNIYLNISCALLMLTTAASFLWLLLAKRQMLRELGKTLWKSEFFDAMVSIAFFLPMLPSVLLMENLAQYLSYASWALSDLVLLAALFVCCKKEIDDCKIKLTEPELIYDKKSRKMADN